jgi:hypothetical protein
MHMRRGLLLVALVVVVQACAVRGATYDDRPGDLPSVNGHECGQGWITVQPHPQTVEDGGGVICRKGSYYVIVNPSPSGQGVASYVSCPPGYASNSQEWKDGLVRAGILSCYKNGPEQTLLVCQISSLRTDCSEGDLIVWKPVRQGMSPSAVSKCAVLKCACRDYSALEMLQHVKVDLRPECCPGYSVPSSSCDD